MYRLLKCTKDTYITNRIVNNSFRATDANVGYAGTLDLFKLWDESRVVGEDQPFEYSRILAKFDLETLHQLTSSILDLNSNFTAKIRLSDVVGGQPVPSNFTVSVIPLSRSFDEGVGRDVAVFRDIDYANWLTASVSNGIVTWVSGGANASGTLGASNIDIITQGDLLNGAGVVSLVRNQTFSSGEEDLSVDVTDIISATLAGNVPDCGFRISFSQPVEHISSTLFVKRFASRHVSNQRLAPKLIVQYDNSYQDNHTNFYFNSTGSLFLFNTTRGELTNIVSGTAATQLTGNGAFTLKLISGAIAPPLSSSFTASFPVDQLTFGNNLVTGIYKSTFAVSSYHPDLFNHVQTAGSASFTTVWGSNDGTVAFKTGSLIIYAQDSRSYISSTKKHVLTIVNPKPTYSVTEVPRVRISLFDSSPDSGLFFDKLPYERVSLIVEKIYWRLIDSTTQEVIIPFDSTNNSTRLSSDSVGMFFDFVPGDLEVGRNYGFEFLLREDGRDIIFDRDIPTFRVMP